MTSTRKGSMHVYDLVRVLMDAEEKLLKAEEKVLKAEALVEALDEKLKVGYKKRIYLLNKIAKTQRKLTANEKELEAEERQN